MFELILFENFLSEAVPCDNFWAEAVEYDFEAVHCEKFFYDAFWCQYDRFSWGLMQKPDPEDVLKCIPYRRQAGAYPSSRQAQVKVHSWQVTSPSKGHTNKLHSEGQFRVTNLNWYAWGFFEWEEAGVPGENPRIHGETMHLKPNA